MEGILIGVGFLLVVLMIVIGTIKSKFKDIYNPIKKIIVIIDLLKLKI